MSKNLGGKGQDGQPRQRSKSSGKSGTGDSAGGSRSGQQKQPVETSANYAEQREAALRIQRNQDAEKNRNVDQAVSDFLDALKTQHELLRGATVNVRVSSGDNINQVTAGEVRAEVERAYQDAHLTDFDQFAGELWTRDRLTVQILHEASSGIEPYFKGVGAKGPSMEDLKTVFLKAAQEVRARALELGEIVGVSHSFDRFIRTIYENSDRVPENLWTIGADGYYERLLSRSINTIDRTYFITDRPVVASDPLGLDRLFQFRFRARRALYDCLSARYGSTASEAPNAGMGPIPTLIIQQTAMQTGGANDAGSRGISATGGPQAAKPMPAQAEPQGSIGDDQKAWQRVQGYVQGECNAPMMQIADSARREGLQPVPARWDAGSAAQQLSSPQILSVKESRPQ